MVNHVKEFLLKSLGNISLLSFLYVLYHLPQFGIKRYLRKSIHLCPFSEFRDFLVPREFSL